MKCIECKTKNILEANYCKKCRHQFTKKEKKLARIFSLVGVLEIKDKIESVIKFKDQLWFQLLLTLFILAIGISTYFTTGISTRINESENYKINYHKKTDTYYLTTKKEKVPLILYVPERVKKIKVKDYTNEGHLEAELDYDPKNPVNIIPDDKEYIILETTYNNGKKDKIKLYVYGEK